MTRKRALVSQSTITKVIKGALKAGAKVSRLEVRPDGSFTIFNEESALIESSSPRNSWDEVLE
jgi:hypothetical protein